MSVSKEERDQWRERLLSHLSCFHPEHATFTLRLLNALNEAETEKEMLEQEVSFWCEETKDVREIFIRQLGYKDVEIARLEKEIDWLISKRFGCPMDGSLCKLKEGKSDTFLCVEHWREAARKAVEEGGESCLKN